MSDTQFTSALGDPFDVANADNLHQPGMLGVSPDVWRSLANFGGNLAAAANARTPQGFLQYGGGFAGPFGAAVSAAQGQGLQRGETLANMGLRRAQTQSQQLQNYVGAMNLPLLQMQNQLQIRMMTDPQFRQQFMQSWGLGAPTFNGGDAQATPHGGATPTTGGASVGDVPKEYMPYYQEASQRTGIPVDVLVAQGKQESGFNPGATGSAGEIGIHQIKPDTATNPGFGLQGVQNPDVLRDPRTNINFAADYLKARAGNIDWSNPAQVATALSSYNGGGDPQYAQHVMRYMPGASKQAAASGGAPQQPYQVAQAGNGPVPVPSQPPVAQPTQIGDQGLVRNPDGTVGTPGGGFQRPAQTAQAQPTPLAMPPVQPQQAAPQAPQAVQPDARAMAQADLYERQANQLEQQRAYAAQLQKMFPGMPVPQPAGDPAALRQAAQQWRQYALAGATAGAQKAAQLPYTITTLRGQGSVALQGGKPIAQVPMEIHKTDPNTGAETTEFVQPIEGTNSGGNLPAPFTSKLGPGQHKAIEASAEDAFGEKSRAQFQSAVGTVRAMEDLDQQFDQLNAQGPGWYNTGAGANWKLELAKSINATAASAGLPPIFDAAKIASGEDILKQSKLAGMQTLSTFFGGQREAASIVQSTQNAVPNIENTPLGGKLVLNGVREAAQWVADQHEFMANWYQSHGGNMVGADVAFNKQAPSQMYTRRGISMLKPFDITSDSELSRYLPGTFVRYKGNIVQVPNREGMPSIPEYLMGAKPVQMAP